MLRDRAATMADVRFMATRLREADLKEIAAAGTPDPEATLAYGLRVSAEPIVGVNERDEPVIMYGACPTSEPLLAGAWLLATEEITAHQMSFLRGAKGQLERLHRVAPVLFNVVDERNTLHIRWLRWMGFTFLARHPALGPERRPFLEFMRHQNV